MTKVLDEVELMFEKTPVKKGVSKKPLKTFKPKSVVTLETASTLQLIGRLYVKTQVYIYAFLVGVVIGVVV